VTAAEPSRCITFKTDRRDGSELLALLNLVQAHPRTVFEWRGENGSIAESARADPASNLTSLVDSSGTTTYGYDVVNNLNSETNPRGGECHHLHLR
jgi:YD repeat-containing protein